MSVTVVEPDILLPERRSRFLYPAGIDNGQSIRIREKGEPGTNGGPRGDLLVEVQVARHPIFQRQDMNIFPQHRSHLHRLHLAVEMRINTVDGEVAYEVKPGTQTDTRIRLKGQRCSVPYVTRTFVVITM